MNDRNTFVMDCADCRTAITRFHRGSIGADQLIAILRSYADRHPVLQPLATAWMEAERVGIAARLRAPGIYDDELYMKSLQIRSEPTTVSREVHPATAPKTAANPAAKRTARRKNI